MGLSGGMDSVTLLAHLLHEGYDVFACIFSYGSKHNVYENKAARNVIEYYQKQGAPVREVFLDISGVTTLFKSDLLLSGGEIPEGHYEAESMKSTVVPGRNLIFTSIMAGLAESVGAVAVALGVHSGDHHIYPDCRPEFIKSADTTVYLSSDKKVQIVTPFTNYTKLGILRVGYNLFVPYELTRTCYKNQELSCGKCGSCQERLEAFALFGKTDPIQYE